ncbi:hypothetical protein BB559_004943 [Furculomyces boomerangus]|uniref:Ketoreductase domain-containing protein n=1 Tax=Furculomyces boomerangus TaxID=61424 RepID=A0A2T9YBV7_9FUNG|nr:hypothetical protein BB559_004943 [Furculomyces boomerangus]
MIGHTAVIIGGTGGIGQAICKKFVQQGANVVVCGRNTEILDSMKRELGEMAKNCERGVQRHMFARCNLEEVDEIRNLVKSINTNYSSIDTLVNAAGISINSLLIKTTDEKIEKVLRTNLISTIQTSKIFAKQFIKQKNGNIINISSIVGQHGNVGQTVYAASKAGIIGFSKALAKELGPKNIRINVICPGLIKTNMTTGLPEDVAEGVLYLAKAEYVTGSVS